MVSIPPETAFWTADRTNSATQTNHVVRIPASGFIAGENVLTVRKTTANGATWINCRRYMLSLGKMNDGTMILFR